MPIIQISVRAIPITEPLSLKAGDWLIVQDDDSYRRATKNEAATLAAGAPRSRTGGNGVALQSVPHPPLPEIQRKTIRLDVAGKTVSLSGQMYRVLRAVEAATRATKSATSTTIIGQHCLWPADRQQVAARIIELKQRGFVAEEAIKDGIIPARRQYRPTNNGLALLLASPAPG